MTPELRWIDDVAAAITAVAIGGIVSATLPDAARKRLAAFVVIALGGIVYLSYKHRRDARED